MNLKNNLKEKVKVPFGIWMPNARVLCYKCHGNTFSNAKYNPKTNKTEDVVLNEEEFKAASEPKILEKGNDITRCNNCKKEIQVYNEVANENNLSYELAKHNVKSYMVQTGGMNSALEIPLKDDGFIWVTYDTCGDNDWCLCFYDKDGEYTDEHFVTFDKSELLDYILKLDNLR